MKILLLLFGFCMSIGGQMASAQNVSKLSQMEPKVDFENIHVVQLSSDSNSTGFLIWVKNKVNPHYHRSHTETLYILSGSGKMIIKDSTFNIAKGDYFVIAPGVVHSVEVTSTIPLKVLSIQSPEFIGVDRTFMDYK